jgi:hypothetical protein
VTRATARNLWYDLEVRSAPKYFQESVPRSVLLARNELKDHRRKETMNPGETYVNLVDAELVVK